MLGGEPSISEKEAAGKSQVLKRFDHASQNICKEEVSEAHQSKWGYDNMVEDCNKLNPCSLVEAMERLDTDKEESKED